MCYRTQPTIDAEEHEGTTYTLTFTGTLDSETSMKGSIGVVPSDSEGDFSAKKQ